MGTGVYEGIPLCPTLFSNARNRDKVKPMVTAAALCEFVLIVWLSPLCMRAYGNKLEEIVLFNIGSSVQGVQLGMVSLYAVNLIFTSAINIVPLVDTVNSQLSISGDSSLIKTSQSQERWVRIAILSVILMISLTITHLEIIYLVNGFICASFF